MVHLFSGRIGHYPILLLIGILLFFPNLGAHTLWDIDESHNAECAREMMVADNLITPTFNFVLRTDKPALQYWFIILAYHMFGVTEFAARFWSVICGLGTMLLAYELGRKMFDAVTGLLAGLILASSFMFSISAHAATPDAFLILLTTASCFIFWHGYTSGSGNWLIGFGVTTGLAVLAKGPVGLVLPATVNLLFLIWERRWRILFDRRLIVGAVLFGVIAGPWYGLVAGETKWEFWKGFFLKHNLQRFQTPLEGHRGPFFYHPVALLAAFAPWSCFLGMTLWLGTGRRARADVPGDSPRMPSAYRYLWCWITVWLVVFSAASTKLPNYLLPCYPALALLTARALARWRSGAIIVSPCLVAPCLACLALVGVVVSAAALVASGVSASISIGGRQAPELAPWALLGVVPIAGAILAGIALAKSRRADAVAIIGAGSLLFVGVLAASIPVVMDGHKVTRGLAEDIAHHQTEREIQIGCHGFYQPGLVFYSGRKVEVFRKEQEAIDHLHSPLEAFLIVPAAEWERLAPQIECPAAVIARRSDFASGQDIVLVTNRPSRAVASLQLP
jgi:4-amino-4-deoxy-L-arabinose transferase-like glycosyltransferase